MAGGKYLQSITATLSHSHRINSGQDAGKQRTCVGREEEGKCRTRCRPARTHTGVRRRWHTQRSATQMAHTKKCDADGTHKEVRRRWHTQRSAAQMAHTKKCDADGTHKEA
eukprot:366245-Chlamydomonas_euryale.AAC.32